MSFATELDARCNALGCTNKQIANACGMQAATLSRYRHGVRTPEAGGPMLRRLAAGLARLAQAEGLEGAESEQEVFEALDDSLTGWRMVGLDFNGRLDALMTLLGIRNSDLAPYTNVSSSYISRVRSGQRTPADKQAFALDCARVAARVCDEQDMADDLKRYLGANTGVGENMTLEAETQPEVAELLHSWLLGDTMAVADTKATVRLFDRLDTLYFDEPSARRSAPASAEYLEEAGFGPGAERSCYFYGERGLAEAIDLFLSIVETRATRLFVSSDIPLSDSDQVGDRYVDYFGRLAAFAQSGGRIEVVHNIARPVSESVLILERWLPFYLRGQAVPYCLGGVHSRLFYHLNYVSDAGALSSEVVTGHLQDGRQCLSTTAEDIEYYWRKRSNILESTQTLIEFVREDEGKRYERFSADEALRRERGRGYEVLPDRYRNISVWFHPGDCVVVSILRPPVTHIIVRHPKLMYIVGHL